MKLAYANITCGILSPHDFKSRGNELLKLLERHSWLTPTHTGNFEPIGEPYRGVQGGLLKWNDPFLWKNRNTKVAGSIWWGRGVNHSCVFIHQEMSRTAALSENWRSVLLDACPALLADYGYVHLTTESEMGDGAVFRQATDSIDVGVTSHDLRKGIPNLCWANYFGPAYQEIDNHLKQVSAFENQKTSLGRYIQTTSTLESLVDYGQFKVHRDVAKKDIAGYFVGVDKSALWTPQFSIKNEDH